MHCTLIHLLQNFIVYNTIRFVIMFNEDIIAGYQWFGSQRFLDILCFRHQRLLTHYYQQYIRIIIKQACNINHNSNLFNSIRLIMLSCMIFTQYIILQNIIVKNMIYNLLSTKAKSNQDKGITSTKFFKKMSTDQNEKNSINLMDKHFKMPQSTRNIISLTTAKMEDQKLKAFSKNKKSQINFINLSKPTSKIQINGMSTDHFHHSNQKDNVKTLRKESSSKNLKLTTSTSAEFPHLLAKSVSQTTINRKMDQNKLRLLEKIGMKKKNTEAVQKQLTISQFKLGKKLGSGRFGNVYLAEQKLTRGIFAIKVMNKLKIKEADMESQVFWEIKLQTFMNHPNILKLYGFFDDTKNIYLILQYCSNCLFKDFRTKVKLSEQQTSYYGKQLISALKYMHNQNIIHRDIKPQNIMIQHGVMKLSDFGWSTYSPLYKRSTFCGTVDYVPPEIVEGSQYDERVDIWALGILLYELASGHAPFQTKDQNITYDKIVNSQCKYPQHFSKQLRDVVAKILDKRPEKRPNLQQIEGDQWFQKYKGVGRYISKQIWSSWDKIQ